VLDVSVLLVLWRGEYDWCVVRHGGRRVLSFFWVWMVWVMVFGRVCNGDVLCDGGCGLCLLDFGGGCGVFWGRLVGEFYCVVFWWEFFFIYFACGFFFSFCLVFVCGFAWFWFVFCYFSFGWCDWTCLCWCFRLFYLLCCCFLFFWALC